MKQNKKVILINPIGAAVSLNTENGLDIKKLGKAKIHRSSEIEWWEESQCYTVKFLRGECAGDTLSLYHFQTIHLQYAINESFWISQSYAACFATYSAAIEAEVAVINHARATGNHHLVGDEI